MKEAESLQLLVEHLNPILHQMDKQKEAVGKENWFPGLDNI